MEPQEHSFEAQPAPEVAVETPAALPQVEAVVETAPEEPAYIPESHAEPLAEQYEKPISDDAATMPHYPKPHFTLEEALSAKQVNGEEAQNLATYLRDLRKAA